LIVQTLAPKGRGKWKEYSSYKSDEEGEDDGMGGQKARIKEKVSTASVLFSAFGQCIIHCVQPLLGMLTLSHFMPVGEEVGR
jgi:hypothetical protein